MEPACRGQPCHALRGRSGQSPGRAAGGLREPLLRLSVCQRPPPYLRAGRRSGVGGPASQDWRRLRFSPGAAGGRGGSLPPRADERCRGRSDRRVSAARARTRHGGLYRGFVLHRPSRRDSRARLRRLFHPAQDSQAAAPFPQARARRQSTPPVSRRGARVPYRGERGLHPQAGGILSDRPQRAARSGFSGRTRTGPPPTCDLSAPPSEPLLPRQERTGRARHFRAQPVPALRLHLRARSGAGRARLRRRTQTRGRRVPRRADRAPRAGVQFRPLRGARRQPRRVARVGPRHPGPSSGRCARASPYSRAVRARRDV